MADRLTVRQVLAQAGLAPIDAQVLLAHVVVCNRSWLIAHANDALDRAHAETFFALARRRRNGEPVAYLTGRREFWGLALDVDRSVLIPRPETETLVEAALQKLSRDRPVRVLDLGTGSGAIALALAHECPLAQVIATDRSEAALAIAAANARRLGIANVRCVQSNWYAALAPGTTFDLISSNPPYVADGDPHLREGDVRFEPRTALASGPDGLADLRTIISGAPPHLAAGGWLLVEHGFDQARAVGELLRAAGFFSIGSLRDLSGVPRVAVGQRA